MRDVAAAVKRCPQCGRLLGADSLRCGYCLAEVRDIGAKVELPPLRPVRTNRRRLRDGRLVRRVTALPRWVLLGVFVLVVAGGWISYQRLRPEPTLTLPASTARSLPVSAAVWSGPNGDTGNTRSTTATVDLASARVRWETDLGVVVSGEPVADAERLYVATTDNRVIALNLDGGTVAWTYTAAVPIGDGALAAGDRVLVTTRRGDVVSLDAASGAVVWETALPTNFYTAPALRDGVVFAFGARDEMFGLEAEDGRVLWTVGHGSDWATEAPLVTAEGVIVSTANTVKVFDRVHGNLTLEHPHGRMTGMALSDGVLVTVSANFISAIDPSARLPWWWGARGVWFDLWVWGLAPEPPRSGLKWIHDLRPQERGPQTSVPAVFGPAIGDGLAIVASDQGVARAFELGREAERWNVATEAATGSPVVTPAGVMIPSRNSLSLRSFADGSELARFDLASASRRALVVTTAGAFLVDRQGRITAVR